MIDRFIVAAGGSAKRFGGLDKCQLQVDGETLLERIERQLRPQDLFVATRPGVIHPKSGAYQSYAALTDCDVDKFLGTQGFWGLSGALRICILFGDVWYSDQAIQTICADRCQELVVWYGRRGPNRIKDWGELFAVTFRVVDGSAGIFEDCCWELRYQFLHGQRSSCRGWDVLELVAARCSAMQTLVEIDDDTEDFDRPEEYLKWLKLTVRQGAL